MKTLGKIKSNQSITQEEIENLKTYFIKVCGVPEKQIEVMTEIEFINMIKVKNEIESQS